MHADERAGDTVRFHAQQRVEKYLKALLVVSGRDFPKTHDMGWAACRVGAGGRGVGLNGLKVRPAPWWLHLRYGRLL